MAIALLNGRNSWRALSRGKIKRTQPSALPIFFRYFPFKALELLSFELLTLNIWGARCLCVPDIICLLYDTYNLGSCVFVQPKDFSDEK